MPDGGFALSGLQVGAVCLPDGADAYPAYR